MTLMEYKENNGLSYRGLAHILEMNHDRVFLYCKGKRMPNLNTILDIEEKTEGEVSVRDWDSRDNDRK